MGRILSQPIPIKKHAKLIDVSTPHVNEDIANKVITFYNTQPAIFKIKMPILFIERDTGNLDAGSTGNKYWSQARFKLLASFLNDGIFCARLYSSHSNVLTDVYIYDHNKSKRIANIRGNSGEYETNIDISSIDDDDIIQVGIDVYQPVSGAFTKVYTAYAELDYISEGEA